MTIDEMINQIENESSEGGNTGARIADVLRAISEKTGKDGTMWHTGAGTPDIQVGNIYDLYLELQVYNIFKKVNLQYGTSHKPYWLLIGNIKGKSAYESAVEGGYNGTENDFNKLLAELGK